VWLTLGQEYNKKMFFLSTYNRVIHKVTLFFTPPPYVLCFRLVSPLSVVSVKVRTFLLNVGMKCLSFSIECTRFESNYSSCTRSSSAVQCAQEKRKHRMKLSLPPKLVEKKLVWVPVISFCKKFIGSQLFPFVKSSFPIN
jgi:hypothetical protein